MIITAYIVAIISFVMMLISVILDCKGYSPITATYIGTKVLIMVIFCIATAALLGFYNN